ncbi:MAG: ribonuclease III [Erysipelothrix sp.]|nr:ribonuclease III [Erysipelothrix sp.]
MIHSGNVLAFIGDGVMTLQVREHLVSKGITNTKVLQETSVKFVSANAQRDFVQILIEQNILNEKEMQIYKRGRNAKSQSAAKNADIVTYRIATGLEALWGYLYLNKELERLEVLWDMYKEMVDIR